MNITNITISLELLLLNDLLGTNVIDQDTYDMAASKIGNSTNLSGNQTITLLATDFISQ